MEWNLGGAGKIRGCKGRVNPAIKKFQQPAHQAKLVAVEHEIKPGAQLNQDFKKV